MGLFTILAGLVQPMVPSSLSHHPHSAGGFNLIFQQVKTHSPSPLLLLIPSHSHIPRYLSADVYDVFVKHFHFLELTELSLSRRCSCLEDAMS